MRNSLDEIRDEYGWDSGRFGNGELCQGSVPQVIVAFLDGNDFEDCIRNAISVGGGDSDPIGCITGGIAVPLQQVHHVGGGSVPTERRNCFVPQKY